MSKTDFKKMHKDWYQPPPQNLERRLAGYFPETFYTGGAAAPADRNDAGTCCAEYPGGAARGSVLRYLKHTIASI